jgi:hypothetical protein
MVGDLVLFTATKSPFRRIQKFVHCVNSFNALSKCCFLQLCFEFASQKLIFTSTRFYVLSFSGFAFLVSAARLRLPPPHIYRQHRSTLAHN